MQNLKHLWPPKLREIAEYCGDSVAISVWKSYHGVTITIPCDAAKAEALIRNVGLGNAYSLLQHFAGEQFQVPKAQEALRAVRNAAIRHARSVGTPLATLAHEYDLTERQILTICNDSDTSLQSDIFIEQP